MSKYFGNAFSLQMVSFPCTVDVREVEKSEMFDSFCVDENGGVVTPEEAARIGNVYNITEVGRLHGDITSVVGHPDTARVLGVPYNRVSMKLTKGDVLYVAQLVGGRLPEGATTLPDGYTFKFLKVTVE